MTLLTSILTRRSLAGMVQCLDLKTDGAVGAEVIDLSLSKIVFDFFCLDTQDRC